MRERIELSVHQLVDFLLRKGDIDNRVFNRSSQTEGSRLHAVYQSSQNRNYISEYPLKQSFVIDDVEITIQGRADGIIKKSSKEYIIDEIKTTVIDLKEFRDENLQWHLGQAKCYAYMFAHALSLDHIGIRLTYIRQGKESEKFIDEYTFLTIDLENDIYDLLNQYLEFYQVIIRLNEERNKSVETLEFPFTKYRKGQKELVKYVYGAIKNKEKLFIEAPTGIGKTMSCIYPAIKYFTENKDSKIFYLTAKATGKENAHHALKILKENGLSMSDIIITSKEKMCFTKEKNCNPDECPYTKGYYNKIKNVIKESIISYDDFDYDTIAHIANKHMVCPFELELDLSLFCDVVICDYNYVFDPTAYMKRYFDENSSNYIILVDEAHNLVDRSKSMYSAELSYESFLKAKKAQSKIPNRKIKTALAKINNVFLSYIDEFEEGESEVTDFKEDGYNAINRFINKYQEVSKENNKDISKELTNFYIDVNRFIKISEMLSDRFLVYVNKQKSDLKIKFFCLDPSRFLASTMSKVNSTTLFSATLSPISYYIDTLGGDVEKSPNLVLDSPFPKENLKLLIAPKISTRYKNRDKSYQEVANMLVSFVSVKKGNYFIYLPSYEYLDNLLKVISFPEDVDLFVQNRDMSEKNRAEFIKHFKENKNRSTVGLAIIGGAFGEGIDLVGDYLIGVAIVGIGLPKLNFESNKIVDYYSNTDVKGFNYAYTFPGMNKVMQAVGRLIRSEDDKGAALLIDERYMWNEYRILFKKEWDRYEVVYNENDIKESLQKFFKV